MPDIDTAMESFKSAMAVQEPPTTLEAANISAVPASAEISSEEIKCPNCGTKLSANSKFCQECGNKIEIKKPAFCTQCGEPVVAGAKFCANCGASLV